MTFMAENQVDERLLNSFSPVRLVFGVPWLSAILLTPSEPVTS
jgi:hypothetical protein